MKRIIGLRASVEFIDDRSIAHSPAIIEKKSIMMGILGKRGY